MPLGDAFAVDGEFLVPFVLPADVMYDALPVLLVADGVHKSQQGLVPLAFKVLRIDDIASLQLRSPRIAVVMGARPNAIAESSFYRQRERVRLFLSQICQFCVFEPIVRYLNPALWVVAQSFNDAWSGRANWCLGSITECAILCLDTTEFRPQTAVRRFETVCLLVRFVINGVAFQLTGCNQHADHAVVD